MKISPPGSLKAFVDEQVDQRGYGSSSEYVRELIRRDHDLLQLRSVLLSGASSAPTRPVDDDYFEGLRARVRGGGKVVSKPAAGRERSSPLFRANRRGGAPETRVPTTLHNTPKPLRSVSSTLCKEPARTSDAIRPPGRRDMPTN